MSDTTVAKFKQISKSFKNFKLFTQVCYVNSKCLGTTELSFQVGNKLHPISNNDLVILKRNLAKFETCKECQCCKSSNKSLTILLKNETPVIVCPDEMCSFKKALKKISLNNPQYKNVPNKKVQQKSFLQQQN